MEATKDITHKHPAERTHESDLKNNVSSLSKDGTSRYRSKLCWQRIEWSYIRQIEWYHGSNFASIDPVSIEVFLAHFHFSVIPHKIIRLIHKEHIEEIRMISDSRQEWQKSQIVTESNQFLPRM